MSNGIVYFIECADRIKIGFTKRTVAKRIRGLTTGAPDDLKVLAAVEGSVPFERAIHKAAKQYRVRGEWFKNCPEVRDLMHDIVFRGHDAIGFVEPLLEAPREPSGEGPLLKPIYERITATIDRYFGDDFKDARATEKEIGLPDGQLIDRIIGGHYSQERFNLAIGMMEHSIGCSGSLYEYFIQTLLNEDLIEQAVLVPRAEFIAARLERGLQRLFASPDMSILDVSGYDGASLSKPEQATA